MYSLGLVSPCPWLFWPFWSNTVSVQLFSALLSCRHCNKRGLKQHKLITSHFWRSEVWHGSHRAEIKESVGLVSFPDAPGENPFSCLLYLLQAALFPGSQFLSIFITSNGQWSLPDVASFSLTHLPPSFTVKDPCDYLGPTWDIQDPLSFKSAD